MCRDWADGLLWCADCHVLRDYAGWVHHLLDLWYNEAVQNRCHGSRVITLDAIFADEAPSAASMQVPEQPVSAGPESHAPATVTAPLGVRQTICRRPGQPQFDWSRYAGFELLPPCAADPRRDRRTVETGPAAFRYQAPSG